MKRWLMKSEPGDYSISDLERDGTEPWTGIRNYQARNFMMRDMRVGDGVLFYHSSCEEPGIVGIAEVCSGAHPDLTALDPEDKYYDPKSDPAAPRWHCVDVAFVRKTRLMGLQEMRGHPQLAGMAVLRRGNRLSITPVSAAEWRFIVSKI